MANIGAPILCCCGSGSAAIGLAVLAIAGTGVLVTGLGLGGVVSLKTVSITTICTSPGNLVTLVLSILGLTGHLGMRAVAGTALAFSSVGVITGVALLGLGCCYSKCAKEILQNKDDPTPTQTQKDENTLLLALLALSAIIMTQS